MNLFFLYGIGASLMRGVRAQAMNQHLMQMLNHARKSVILAGALTIVVMIFAGSSFGPSFADGPPASIVVAVLNAPAYLLDLEGPLFREFPVLGIAVIALLEFLYFLGIAVAVRAFVDALRSVKSANGP